MALMNFGFDTEAVFNGSDPLVNAKTRKTDGGMAMAEGGMSGANGLDSKIENEANEPHVNYGLPILTSSYHVESLQPITPQLSVYSHPDPSKSISRNFLLGSFRAYYRSC